MTRRVALLVVFVVAAVVLAAYGWLADNHTALQLAGLLVIASVFNVFPAVYLNRRDRPG